MSKVWVINGYDSLTETFSEIVPEGKLTDAEIVALLKCLMSRHLVDREVFSGFLGTTTLLDVSPIGGNNHGYRTTGNPHYTATLRNAD